MLACDAQISFVRTVGIDDQDTADSISVPLAVEEDLLAIGRPVRVSIFPKAASAP
jgi:hypothetical protein